MNGKIVAGSIVITALAAGIAIYWLQEYAFYDKAVFSPGAEIVLTPIQGGPPEAIVTENLQGIDAESSPIRFRACFTTPLSLGMLTETYAVYPDAEPLVAPTWFDCFDATAIGEALETGEAVAFLSQAEVRPGIDRVVAVFPDGKAYAWTQVRKEAEAQSP
ncbi:MAG: histidine kinase [Exiguobacterium profundum]|nr:MAG: histidine kinase [Exiguobacterium profundum]